MRAMFETRPTGRRAPSLRSALSVDACMAEMDELTSSFRRDRPWANKAHLPLAAVPLRHHLPRSSRRLLRDTTETDIATGWIGITFCWGSVLAVVLRVWVRSHCLYLLGDETRQRMANVRQPLTLSPLTLITFRFPFWTPAPGLPPPCSCALIPAFTVSSKTPVDSAGE